MKIGTQPPNLREQVSGIPASRRLVRGERLLELIFPDEGSRPCTKWLHQQRTSRSIPYKRVGRLIFYDPDEVRAAFDKCTIKAI